MKLFDLTPEQKKLILDHRPHLHECGIDSYEIFYFCTGWLDIPVESVTTMLDYAAKQTWKPPTKEDFRRVNELFERKSQERNKQ